MAGGAAVHHSVAYAYTPTHLQSPGPEAANCRDPAWGPAYSVGEIDSQAWTVISVGYGDWAATPSGKPRGAAREASGEAKVKQRGALCKYRDPTK